MKSIIFNQHQVNHALKNEEGMFREVIKGNELEISHPAIHSWKQSPNDGRFYVKAKNDEVKQRYVTTFPFGGIKPPYQVGETIFVKESFCHDPRRGVNVTYKQELLTHNLPKEFMPSWKPAQHMKQEHSRLTLKIKSVKVERLADISEEDAVKDGGVFKSDNYWHSTLHPTKQTYQCWTSAKEAFAKLWNSTHKKPEEKWEANPFVFCFSYEVVR